MGPKHRRIYCGGYICLRLWACGLFTLFASFRDIVSLYIPRELKKGFPTADTYFANVCWVALSWFINCSSNGSLVMGLFVILISRQSDFIKSFTSLLHIPGLDATGISLRLWKRFVKRMFRVHGCIKADGKLVRSNACSVGEPFCSLVLSVLKPVGTSFLSANIFVEGDYGERQKSHEAPKSVTRCIY